MRTREVVLLAALAAAIPMHAEGARPEREHPRLPLPRAAGNQYNPATATDGVDFIAVWEDHRAASQIVMTIVRDGQALAPKGIVVSGSQLRCNQPAVIWNGNHYLIAWSIPGSTFMVRVSSDGELLDAAPRLVFANSVPYPTRTLLAFNGQLTLVAATSTDDDAHIAALDRGGNVVDSLDRKLNFQNESRLVAVGDHFEFINANWAFGGMTATAITFDGKKLRLGSDRDIDGKVFPLALSAASNGDRAIVLYVVDDFSTERLMARTISANGAIGPRVEITHGFMEKDPANGYYAGYMSPIWTTAAAADGNGFTAAWTWRAGSVWSPLMEESKHHKVQDTVSSTVPTYDLQAARLDATGQLRSTFPLVEGEPSEETPAIASNGYELLTLWSEDFLRYPGAQKIAAKLSKRFDLSVSRPMQDTPRIAFGNDSYVVVWREEPNNDGFGVIMAQRYDRDGIAMETPRRLSSSTNAQSAPSVAFNGREFAIAWIDQGLSWNIFMRRMTPDGQWIDAAPLALFYSPYGLSFGLTSNGSNFGFAYLPGSPWFNYVVLGTIAKARLIDAGAAAVNSDVVVAASGSDYVAAWQTGSFFDATTAASAGDSVRRLQSYWPYAPVVACSDVSCMSIAYRSYQDRTLVARAFHPLFDVPPFERAFHWSYDGVRLASRGRDFLAAGKVGMTIRAAYLTPSSDEIDVVTKPIIGALDVALSDSGFAVAYTAAGDDGAMRVFVKAIKR